MRANVDAAAPSPLEKLKVAAAYTWLTTAKAGQIAGGVKSAQVRDWIRQGILPALNVSPGKTRPEYRIDPADLAVFIEQMLRASAA